MIRALKWEGTTTVLTTHYLDEAAQLADRVAVITAGRLQAIGSIAEFGGEAARTPIVRWMEDATPREKRSMDPCAFATDLAARLGRTPQNLEIVRPSLEDVYLALIERTGAIATEEKEDAR